MKKITDLNPTGQRVIVRVDWNVPITPDGRVADQSRIVATLPTLQFLVSHGVGQIVLLAHLGKAEEKKSLRPVALHAETLLGESITFHETKEHCRQDTKSHVLMLENLRLFAGEDLNEDAFACELASLGSQYVNEAFGECHRSSASIVGLAHQLPHYAGLRLVQEVEAILKVRHSPDHPSLLIMGGAKVNDKIKLLEKMSQLVDVILLGGKLANEFVSRALHLSGAARVLTPVDGIGAPYMDIGPATRELYAHEIAQARTIVWNGPMGKIEDPQYRAGTEAIYDAFVANESAFTLVGGGDTLAALTREEHTDRIDFMSTGGGAMLKLLENGTLPGIEVLES